MSEFSLGQYNKAAKASKMMAFDCPLRGLEILEGLQGASEGQHGAVSHDQGGVTALKTN